MAVCEVCGNEIPDFSGRCSFCNSSQRQGRTRRGSSRKGTSIRDINLKAGMPSVEEGLERLERALQIAGHEGACILRIIHGYGSTGSGGKLKPACRAMLKQKIALRQIRGFLPGEDYSRSSSAGKALIKRHPALGRTERMDRCNPGITFVEM